VLIAVLNTSDDDMGMVAVVEMDKSLPLGMVIEKQTPVMNSDILLKQSIH
jgi:hypothetical protein